MSRSGIVNVRMVITEEKILSNIDKIQKLINPNSKKQIVQLEEDNYFLDLIASIKSYLEEYPKDIVKKYERLINKYSEINGEISEDLKQFIVMEIYKK